MNRHSPLNNINNEKNNEDNPLKALDPEDLKHLGNTLCAQALKAKELPDMPDDETLICFADGTLRGANRATVQEIARSHPAAAVLILDFVKEYTPVRELCTGWMGWKGPLLAALGRLPGKAMSADNSGRAAEARLATVADWDAHLLRCSHSRERTRVAKFLLGWMVKTVQPSIKPSWRLGFMTVAAGGYALAGCCILLMVSRYPVRIPSQAPIEVGNTVPKDGQPSTSSDSERPLKPDENAEQVNGHIEDRQAATIAEMKRAQTLLAHTLKQAGKTVSPSEKTKFEALADKLEIHSQKLKEAADALDK